MRDDGRGAPGEWEVGSAHSDQATRGGRRGDDTAEHLERALGARLRQLEAARRDLGRGAVDAKVTTKIELVHRAGGRGIRSS
jgi:hypothetical protein